VWPVALDDNMKIWKAFGNQYWPADYVADRTGRLRYTHFGEGDYTNTENVLRTLLGVPPTSPRANPQHPESTAAATVNPETYLGTQQTTADVASGVHTYRDPGALPAPEVALRGTWDGESERVTAVQAGASIVLGVHASEVNLVLAKQGGAPIDAVVLLNGKPVPKRARGAAITVDAKGNTVVKVDAPDMYRLTLTPTVEDYTLTIIASQPGLEAYDFTFG
jgi:hypothetical protein